MKDFEYAIGEMVRHKHWRIVGEIERRSVMKDQIGGEYHYYAVVFGRDQMPPHTTMLHHAFLTEFELTKTQTTHPEKP